MNEIYPGHISPLTLPSSPLPAKGAEESSLRAQQNMLRHRWGSLPDHSQRAGLLSPDLPAGCGSGNLTRVTHTTKQHITNVGLICGTRKTQFSFYNT